MKKVLALIAIVIFSAFQTAPVLRFEFTVPEAEMILKALSKLPYEETAPLINKITFTANKQLTDTTKNKK